MKKSLGHVNSKSQTEIETLKAEIERLENVNSDIIDENDKLEKEIVQWKKQVNELQTKAEVWENHAKHVEKKLIEAEQDLEQSVKTHELLQSNIDGHEATIEALHKEIETITKFSVEQIKLILKNE
jgi:chromosome segregation ATPase